MYFGMTLGVAATGGLLMLLMWVMLFGRKEMKYPKDRKPVVHKNTPWKRDQE